MAIYKFGRFGVDSQIELDLSQASLLCVDARVVIIANAEQATLNSMKLVCEIDGIGLWWISGDCALIFVQPFLNPGDVRIRDITCRVLARCLGSAHGIPVLHAAAVCRDGSATVLIGRQGAGKSTLAWGLSKMGYQLLADDNVLLFDRGDQIQTSRSTHAVRLTDHSLSMLGLSAVWPRVSQKNLVVVNTAVSDDLVSVGAVVLLGGSRSAACLAADLHAVIFEIVQSLWNWCYADGKIDQEQLALIARLVRSTPVIGIDSRQPLAHTVELIESLSREQVAASC